MGMSMTKNNNERMNIILAMLNKYDYEEFIGLCSRKSIAAFSIAEFAQKIGMLEVATYQFPQLSPAEAYNKFIENMNKAYSLSNGIVLNNGYVRPPEPKSDAKPCGGCGK